MRPLIFMTVGYMIGFIWGLYLKMNIVPIIFLFIFIIYLFRKKLIKLEKYKNLHHLTSKVCGCGTPGPCCLCNKINIILMIIFMIISNVRVLYLENKFDTLYRGLEKVEVIGIITKEGMEKEYKTEYEIKVESINGDKKYKNTNLILYVKSKEKIEYGKKVKLIRRISKTFKRHEL